MGAAQVGLDLVDLGLVGLGQEGLDLDLALVLVGKMSDYSPTCVAC